MAHGPTRGLSALALALSLPLFAQGAAVSSAVSNQVSVADIHADMAVDAADLSTVQLHLHHVINCLEGPAGKDFDAKATNPCHGMGQGAIVDAKDDPHVEARLNEALQQTRLGLRAKTPQDARASAQRVFNLLQRS